MGVFSLIILLRIYQGLVDISNIWVSFLCMREQSFGASRLTYFVRIPYDTQACALYFPGFPTALRGYLPIEVESILR
jgi:hypothetical protein